MYCALLSACANDILSPCLLCQVCYQEPLHLHSASKLRIATDKPALTPEFSLQNWPADSPKVQPYLEELKVANSYRPIPLPAYDLGGDLIRPGVYRDMLQGATVAIKFALCHYGIGEVDGYAADITYIRVLVPPPVRNTPRKRNTRLTDPISPPSPPSPSRYVPPVVMRDTARSYAEQSRARGSLEYDNSEDYKPPTSWSGIFTGPSGVIEDKEEGSSKGVTARMRKLRTLMACLK